MIAQSRIKELFDYNEATGKNIYLGIHKTYDEAVAARMAANKKYGFSKSHGRLQEMAA